MTQLRYSYFRGRPSHKTPKLGHIYERNKIINEKHFRMGGANIS